jgi:hypothetical protein
MANDKDINIGIRTTADTSGAEAAEKSIRNVEDAVSGAESAMSEFEMITKAQVVAKLGEQLQQIAPQFSAAAESVRGFDEGLADTLETTGQVVSKAGEAATAIASGFAVGGPAGAAVGAAIVAVKHLAGAWVEMKQAQQDAEVAAAAADAYPEYLKKRREFLAENAAEISRLKSIREENAALHDQEDAFNRMIQLRDQLSNQAATAAGQEVQLAKLKDGDVALAEANLIAATLKGDLDKLRGEMSQAQQSLAQASSDEMLAVGRLREAQEKVSAGLISAENANLKVLDDAAKSAGEKQESARETLNGLLSTFGNAQKIFVTKAEIAIQQKENEFEGKISPAAAKAFQNVFDSLGQELAKGPEAAKSAIAQIQADAATVTTAATAKAQEVSAGIQAAAAGASEAVGSIGISAGESVASVNESVARAGDQVKAAISLLGENTAITLAKIAAVAIDHANRLSSLETKVDHIR